MDMVRQFDNDRFYRRATRLLLVVLLLSVVGFGLYYYMDRYAGKSAPKVDQEIARVQQMVKNDPSNAATRISLADLYVHKGAYDQATVQYGEALKMDDSNVAALGGLGLAFFRTGKMKEAQTNFERILDIVKNDAAMQRTPAMASVHYFLGQIYASQGDLPKAESELRAALGINRADADAIYQLAEVVSKEGRLKDAIDMYKLAVSLVPNFKDAYAGLAKAYSATGMDSEAGYATAMVDYSSGNYDAAISRLQTIVQAKPDFAPAYFGLGASYDKKNQPDKATQSYQKSLELDPSNEAARVSLLRLGGTPPAGAVAPSGH